MKHTIFSVLFCSVSLLAAGQTVKSPDLKPAAPAAAPQPVDLPLADSDAIWRKLSLAQEANSTYTQALDNPQLVQLRTQAEKAAQEFQASAQAAAEKTCGKGATYNRLPVKDHDPKFVCYPAPPAPVPPATPAPHK